MTSDGNSRSKFGLRRLESIIPRPPRLTTCIIVYYFLLIVLGAFADTGDPLNGILTLLFVTHLFILMAFSVHGAISMLVVVCVPVGIALCAVALTGWWRVIGVIGLIIGFNLFGIYTLAQLSA